MYRLLLLALAVPLLVPASIGRSADEQYNIDIVAIDLAGRQTNLTHDPAIDVNPAVARDGRIAFFSSRDGEPDLFVMTRGGGNVGRLTNGAVDHSGLALGEDLEWSQASWSPRGDRIAFDGKYDAAGISCEQHCAGWRVLVIGSDGSGLKQIALDARAPAWSPDGRRLAYENSTGGVTIARVDGSGSVQVRAFNPEFDLGPDWSPTGGAVAFQATWNHRTWVYTVRADGTRKRRLAPGYDPSWSADGRRLAFIDNCKLFTIDTDGKHSLRLSRKGEFVAGAAWSPNGQMIAYVSGRRAGGCPGSTYGLRVQTVSTDGKRVHVLARESAASLIWGSPIWTPDGKRILVAVEPH